MQKLPTVTSLRAFEAAARLGSFTRASEELYLAQSAVSRQVRGLEDQLGARLFDLIRQRIVLTQAGRAYLEEIRPILAHLEAASTRVSARAKGVQ
ncbi:MAG: LysR family transcriptional regulator, partial [Proteobacteria bacterium]|nr:LysR family transcriptional regulator [Pseudomonadota bacterium]